MTTSTRPDHLIVIADHTPGVHVTDSEDIWWWTPLIGPASSMLAVLLSRHCRKLWYSLDRLAGFRILNFVSADVATIRLQLPHMTATNSTTYPKASPPDTSPPSPQAR